MNSIQIVSPIAAPQRATVASRDLLARMVAVGIYGQSSAAIILNEYDAQPMNYALSKDGKEIVFKVLLDRPLSAADRLRLDDQIAGGFATTLLFMLNGVDLNSSW